MMFQESLCLHLWVLLSSKLASFSGMPSSIGSNMAPAAQNLDLTSSANPVVIVVDLGNALQGLVWARLSL